MKKVLIPTKLDPIAKELLKANGGQHDRYKELGGAARGARGRHR